MHPDPQILEQLVQRIVEAVHPLRIILFGSAVRGEMTADSDLDVLVVMPEGVHCLHTAQYLHQQIDNIACPIDILVATAPDLDKHKDNIGLIYRKVLQEGREIYAL
jgi:predicted nucleotidyltransferase